MNKRKIVALLVSTGLLLALPFGGCLTLVSGESISAQQTGDPVQAIEALLAPPRDQGQQSHD